MRANRYPGHCHRCGCALEAGLGQIIRAPDNSRWITQCAGDCESTDTFAVGDLSALFHLFDTASRHRLDPVIVLQVRDAAKGGLLAIRMSIGGAKSKTPGAIIITDVDKSPATGARRYVGRVRRGLQFEPASDCHPLAIAPVVRRLKAFASAPLAVALAESQLTQRCMFCQGPLHDSHSQALGYGRTCATAFGLPWKPVKSLTDTAEVA